MDYKNKKKPLSSKVLGLLKRPDRLPYLLGVVVFTFTLLISEWLVHLDTKIHDEQYQAHIAARIEHLSTQLQTAINSNLLIIEAIESLLLLNNKITEREFRILATRFHDSRLSIRQIQLSPDAIVKYVYPDNDTANTVGLNLRSLPEQRKIIEDSIQTRTMIMAGPLELIQGGTALIARQPLYSSKTSEGSFWGFLTLIIDINLLFEDAKIVSEDELTHYVLRGSNAKGSRGKVFFGSEEIFNDHYLSTLINVPGGQWELAASTDNNHSHVSQYNLLSIWGLVASIAFALLTCFSSKLWMQTYHRSIHDPLTQLFDRQHFQKKALIEIERSKRHSIPVAIIMIDLDFFKKINDQNGHQVGDIVLQHAAKLIQTTLRESDIVGRYGGEEFIVMTLHDDEQSVIKSAERLRNSLNRNIVVGNHTIELSGSFGVSILSHSDQTYDDLVFKADSALFQAKGNGRNCVVIASDDTSSEN